MSRHLLTLVLLVTGTGCSATRPLVNSLVVHPARSILRQHPDMDMEKSWKWTAVDVTYPSAALIPAPCAPTPMRPLEMVTYFEDEELPKPWSTHDPDPSSTPIVPLSAPEAQATDPLAIVHLKQATSLSPTDLTASGVSPGTTENPPRVSAAENLPCESNSRSPASSACALMQSQAQVAFVEQVPSSIPATPSELDRSTVDPSAAVHFDDVQGALTADRPLPTTATVASGIPAVAHAVSTLPVNHGRSESPTPVPPDLSELLCEIRMQRKLIEALQRDLTRERSADDAALEELETAFEELLVQTQSKSHDSPSAVRE